MFFLIAWMLLAPSAVPGAEPPKDPAPASVRPRLEVETMKLPNGMTFLLAPRAGAPVFTGYIAFKVGGVDNLLGETGMSHMFEHMAFKGTEHIGTTDWTMEKPLQEELRKAGDTLTLLHLSGRAPAEDVNRLEAEVKRLDTEQHKYIVKDEIDRIYSEAGGVDFNANTAPDTTQYFVSLPANALELWMLVESQRIREPVLREFYTERDVIAQERMERYENDPMGKLYERFLATAFMVAPYRNPGIGWASDIRALTLDGAQRFFDRSYSPANAVAVLCGNFDVALAKSLISKYFGPIPRRGDPLPVITREPAQDSERRTDVAFEAQPMMFTGFHKPTWPHRDDTVMDVIQNLLADGMTSRLYKRLVEKEGTAFMVQAANGVPGTRYDNLLIILAVPGAGTSYDTVERSIAEELDRLKTEPVPSAELEKAKTRIAAGVIKQMEETGGVCALLASYQMITGDWHTIGEYLDGVQGVTPEEIRAAAARYFIPSNRTVARIVPPVPAPGTGSREAKP
jgi:predicted Zn-dependent peptidase